MHDRAPLPRPGRLLDQAEGQKTGQGSGAAYKGTIADFELFGEGVPRRAIYRSRIFDLGAPLNFGRLFWSVTPLRMVDGRLREAPEAEVGIEVLHNRSVDLSLGGASLSLAGVDDLVTGRPDLGAALSRAGSPVLLLSHNPDILFEAARNGVALVLSGHTHAGQIRLPGLPVLIRQSRYRLDEGRYRARGTELLVSRGLGVVGMPLRVACAPEAVLLELRTRRNPA